MGEEAHGVAFLLGGIVYQSPLLQGLVDTGGIKAFQRVTGLVLLEYLAEKGYEAKSKEGESMEVCFIKGDYRDFLREQCPELDNEIGPGWFVNSEGVKLGQHKGAPYYTIGQRKGLEIALGKPAYVLKINPQKNTVMLGDAEVADGLYADGAR